MVSSKVTKRSRKRTSHVQGRLPAEADELIQQAIDEFRTRSEDAKTYVTKYVKDQPLKSLGIAVAVGAVLALIIKK